MKRHGLFITFEGIDGSGKSVQAGGLFKQLESRRLPVHLLRDPGSASISEAIRSILLNTRHDGMSPVTELMLYEAARAQLVDEYIRPALASGDIVISDRFTDSTIAYQGYGRHLSLELIHQANTWICGDVLPHRTYILDIDWNESCLRRASGLHQADRMEREAHDFFSRVRQGYHDLAKAEPDRILLLDGTRSVEILEQEILNDVLYYVEKHAISFKGA